MTVSGSSSEPFRSRASGVPCLWGGDGVAEHAYEPDFDYMGRTFFRLDSLVRRRKFVMS
jgi:hypothetical protein